MTEEKTIETKEKTAKTSETVKKMKRKKKFSFSVFLKNTKNLLAIGISLVLVIIVVVFFLSSLEGTTEVTVETSLKEIVKSSNLSTAAYTYNSIAEVKTKNKKETKYHVSYEGTVKSGFDFEELDITKKGKKIIVIIPQIQIKEVLIDEGSLDFIFTQGNHNTETTLQEALKACNKDLKNKAEENKTLKTTAIESAKEAITAMVKPFESQLEKGESIEIVYIDDVVGEKKK